jgi:hypothetical protein
MPDARDLDHMIDAALGTYADASTDEGIAQRVLARLAHEPAPPRRLRWAAWMAVPIPAVLCLLLLVRFVPRIANRPPAQAAQSAHVDRAASIASQLRPHAAAPTHRAAHRSRQIAAATVSQPLPKLDVFPTPALPSSQERALAVYVAHIPPAAQQALAQSELEPMPLTVASMHFTPVKVADLDASDLGVHAVDALDLDAPDRDANTNF